MPPEKGCKGWFWKWEFSWQISNYIGGGWDKNEGQFFQLTYDFPSLTMYILGGSFLMIIYSIQPILCHHLINPQYLALIHSDIQLQFSAWVSCSFLMYFSWHFTNFWPPQLFFEGYPDSKVQYIHLPKWKKFGSYLQPWDSIFTFLGKQVEVF